MGAVVVFASGVAAAQVNAETLAPDPMQAGWSGGVDGSFALARGNVELVDFGGAVRVQHQTLHPLREPLPPFIAQRVFLTTNGRFAESADAAFVSQAYAHARWTAMWHRRVGSEVFAQYQFNEFLRLQGRTLLGGGARVEFVHREAVMLWGGTGYMSEYNRLRGDAAGGDPPETFEHRWANYLTLRLSLFGDRLLAQNALYVQPRFDRLSDVRVLEELEVVAKVTEQLGLGTTLSVLHDSAPPAGVRTTDLRLASTVRVSF